jgi:transposase InsO family protein
MVVGWAMADHFKTSLITAALDCAAGSIRIEEGCIFHSDRGSNYTSDEFGRYLNKKYKIRRSVGRTGVCWDNAMAESFFGALKNEWLNRMVFATTSQSPPCGCAVHRRLLQSTQTSFRERVPDTA